MEMTMMLVYCLVMAVVTLWMCFANGRLHRDNRWLKYENERLCREFQNRNDRYNELSAQFGKVVNQNIRLQIKEIVNTEDKIDKIKADCRYKCGCPLNKEQKDGEI